MKQDVIASRGAGSIDSSNQVAEAVQGKTAKRAKPYAPPLGLKPGALDKAGTAWYVSLSESTIERGTREGWFPAPRELSPGRVAWLVPELDGYLASRPKSALLPPPNTRHGNRRKPLTAVGSREPVPLAVRPNA